jgi:hypothetical protein
VWINISYMIIDALDRHGFVAEAHDLASRTLDAIARTFYEWEESPRTLWETYAPEFVAPASHKVRRPDKLGGVRGEFAGWACCLINLLIETELGIRVDAPSNTLHWRIRTKPGTGVENLMFGNITASLRVESSDCESKRLRLSITTDAPFTLSVDWCGIERIPIATGSQTVELPTKS